MSGGDITPIGDHVGDIDDRGADDMYVEMQAVLVRYVDRISNAEAIGICEMLKIKIWEDTR